MISLVPRTHHPESSQNSPTAEKIRKRGILLTLWFRGDSRQRVVLWLDDCINFLRHDKRRKEKLNDAELVYEFQAVP